MSPLRRDDVSWYKFWFAGRRVQESSKSTSKTVPKTAEQNRRRELEQGFNSVSDSRRERIRTFGEVPTTLRLTARNLKIAALLRIVICCSFYASYVCSAEHF